jgi:hypothetical protein
MADEPGLATQRDRLVERFALMQSELGGLFYEMAIRDHVKLDVLVARAAALQVVDNELAQVEALLGSGPLPPTGGAPGQATAAPSP